MRSIPILLIIEEALQRCYLDKVLWKYTANLQETTHAKVSEIKYLHGCSTVNLVHIFRTPFRENTSGGLLLISIHCAYWNCFQRELTSYCGSSWTRTQNHLVHKRTLNHLAKLANLMRCVVSTYMYGAFGCMLLACRVRVPEGMQLPECQGTPCTKQARYLKFKWQQRDSNYVQP